MEAKYYLYRNLHKNMFSIKYKGIVIDRNNFQVMKNVLFNVSKKGQERVRKEKRKNVHATVSGFLVSLNELGFNKTTTLNDIKEKFGYQIIELYYNPYITDTFQIKDTKKEIEKFDEKNGFVLAKDNKIYLIIST
jgi:hypothetical protein